MDRDEAKEVVLQWIDKAPTFADFGIVDDIESDVEVLQIFY